jgi:isoquinoline 1-oxidoreductase beta subunit
MNETINPNDARIGRRHFLIGTCVVAGGLLVGIRLGQRSERFEPRAASFVPNAFVRIASDDTITVVIGKSEMGQGVYTTLPVLVAEELDVDPARLKVEFAPVHPAFNIPVFNTQLTGGSSSTRTSYEQLRQAGAMARAMLIAAAAKQWNVDPAVLSTANGAVIHGKRSVRYGDLVEAARDVEPPKTLVLRNPRDFRYIGKTVPRLDSPAKVSGQAQFGIDVRLPDMLFAMVARGPVFGARVRSYDDHAARAVPGVVDVKQIPSGIAVIARDTWSARRGRDALKIDWDLGPGANLSTESLREEYRRLATKPGAVAARIGDARAVLARGGRIVEAEYELPYLAHACMEPLNCVAHVQADRCDIWTGTQWQTQDQTLAAAALGFRPEQVSVHTTFLGGGFGRRANPQSDFVVEAVHVARGLGRAVQVLWTREDDMHGGWYRPFTLHRVRGALDAKGSPIAWYHTIVGQSIFSTVDALKGLVQNGVDPSSVEGVSNLPYRVPNLLVDLHSPTNVVPVQWWRSVGHSHTGFAVNTFVDELAVAARRDPVELRRELLAHEPRFLAVLNTAAEKAGWGTPLPRGRARGIAIQESFGSIVAEVAEVSVEGSEVRVHRVVCAVDCGFAVNPGQVEAQMESGIVYGLSAALHGEITLRDGRVQQSNFHNYPPLRISEMPVVETHIIASGAEMGGIGEPGTPCIAPAVCNAIFAATGKRVRRLPIASSLVTT